MAWTTNHWLILCPNYFTMFPLRSNRLVYCFLPPISSVRQCVCGGQLVFYRPWVILHELAHLYLWQASGVVPNEHPKYVNETYNWNGALDIPALSSILNPQNYAFYVAGKSRSLVPSSISQRLDTVLI